MMMNVTITKEENKPSGRSEREHGLFPSLAFFLSPAVVLSAGFVGEV